MRHYKYLLINYVYMKKNHFIFYFVNYYNLLNQIEGRIFDLFYLTNFHPILFEEYKNVYELYNFVRFLIVELIPGLLKQELLKVNLLYINT